MCICVLKGGYRFFSDLVLKIQNENRFDKFCIFFIMKNECFLFSLRSDRSLPMSLEFIRTRRYINDKSSNCLKITGLSELDQLKDKNVLIVEDIIDGGVTMVTLKRELEKFQPKLIRIVSLITKRRKDKNCVFKPDYCGFEIPDHFIVGYALVRQILHVKRI